ncbi:MAG: tetratricopeptide repeat protein [Candidatus Gracilibacteria bacterium]
MKKINNKLLLILTSIFVITAIIYNYANFLVFFNTAMGNFNFYNGNYPLSSIYHQKSEKKSPDDFLNYNLGGDYYKLGNYAKSLEYYAKINLLSGSNLALDTYYNLGNVFYKLGENERNDIQKKVDLWKKSLQSYNQILYKKEDKKTRENYTFVLKKLNDLIDQTKKNQQGNQDQKKDSDSEKSQKDNTEDKNETGDNNDTQTIQSGRGEEYKIGEKEKLDPLTEEEKKELEEYNKKLRQEQKENSNLFGKNIQENNQDVFDVIRQDPLFNDSILNQGEKDW